MGNKSSRTTEDEDSDREEEYHYHEEILSEKGENELAYYRPDHLRTSFLGREPDNPAIPTVNEEGDKEEISAQMTDGDTPSQDEKGGEKEQITTSPSDHQQVCEQDEPEASALSHLENDQTIPEDLSEDVPPAETPNATQGLLDKSSESESLSTSFSPTKLESSFSQSCASSQSVSSPTSGPAANASTHLSLLSQSPAGSDNAEMAGDARDSPASDENYDSAKEEVENEHETSSSQPSAVTNRVHGRLGVNCFRVDDDEMSNAPEEDVRDEKQPVPESDKVFAPLSPAPVCALPTSPSKGQSTLEHPHPVVLMSTPRSAFMPVRGNPVPPRIQPTLTGSALTAANNGNSTSLHPPELSPGNRNEPSKTPTSSPSKRKVDEVLMELEPGVRRTGGIHRPFSANGTGETNSAASLLPPSFVHEETKRLRGSQDKMQKEDDDMEVTGSPFAGVILEPPLPVPASSASPDFTSPGAGGGSSRKRTLEEDLEENYPDIQIMEVCEDPTSPGSPPRLETEEESPHSPMTGTEVGISPSSSLQTPPSSQPSRPVFSHEMEPKPSISSGIGNSPRNDPFPLSPSIPASSTQHPKATPSSGMERNAAPQILPAGSTSPGQSVIAGSASLGQSGSTGGTWGTGQSVSASSASLGHSGSTGGTWGTGQSVSASSASLGQSGSTGSTWGTGRSVNAGSANRGQSVSAGSASRGQSMSAGIASHGQSMNAGSTSHGQSMNAGGANRGQSVSAGSASRGQSMNAGSTSHGQSGSTGSASRGQSGSTGSAWGTGQSATSSTAQSLPSTSSGSGGRKRPAGNPRMQDKTPAEDFAHGFRNQGYFHFTLADSLTMSVESGDITAQTTQALVNPTDSKLTHSGRLSSAIAAAAGLPMISECRNHLLAREGPLAPSEVVDTCAGGSLDTNVTHILHVVEPEWDAGQDDSDSLSQLIDTYHGLLLYAEELHVASVAFPLIGTCTDASFPLDIAIRAVFDAVLIFLSRQLPQSRLRSLRLVITEPDLSDFIVSFLTPLLEEVLIKGIDAMVAEALNSHSSRQRLEIQQNELNTALAEEHHREPTTLSAALETRLFRGPPVKRPRL